MVFDLIFTILFIFAVYYMLSHSYNIMTAVERSKGALYPKTEEEFKNILLPPEWKEMELLSKDTKSYRLVQWGTAVAIILLGTLFVIILTADLSSSFLSFAYLIVAIILVVRHPGNLFILSDGIILDGKFYPYSQVKSYSTEQVIRWHDLYGLDPKINNAYKLTIIYKKSLPFRNYVVIREPEQLEKIEEILNRKRVKKKNATETKAHIY